MSTIESLRRQLDEAENNLLLIEERKAAYVLTSDIPLQLLKDEQLLRERIADLKRRIEEQPEQAPAGQPAAQRGAQAPAGQPAANQTINNQTDNQGAQGQFYGPVTFHQHQQQTTQSVSGTGNVAIGGNASGPIVTGDNNVVGGSGNQRNQAAREQPADSRLVNLLVDLSAAQWDALLFEAEGRMPALEGQPPQGTDRLTQSRHLVRLARSGKQRSALVESLLVISGAVLGGNDEQREWRAWARQQDGS